MTEPAPWWYHLIGIGATLAMVAFAVEAFLDAHKAKRLLDKHRKENPPDAKPKP